MANLIEQRDALETELVGLRAKGDNLTSDEADTVLAKFAELEQVNADIKKLGDAGAKLGQIGERHEPVSEAKSLGEHFAQHCGEMLAKSGRTVFAKAPAFKAAGDAHAVTGGPLSGLVQVDQTVVEAPRQRPTVAQLLSSGTMTGTSLTYFVEGAREGSFATVPELGKKPQLHYTYTEKTDGLAKIAGFIKESDEMIKDRAFLVSAINGRLLYDLAMFEEAQLLSGNGTGTNLQGLLNRSGVQTETSAAAGDNPDAVFRALTKVQTGSGLAADGIVLHPLDYQAFRLAKDANAQYYGGGFFTGQYGQGGVMSQPGLWGLPTVVTTAIPQGTALVGAFKQAATVYRKGGIEVEATNTNEDDFVFNRVTVRAEERIGLACRMPAALVKLTLKAATAPATP